MIRAIPRVVSHDSRDSQPVGKIRPLWRKLGASRAPRWTIGRFGSSPLLRYGTAYAYPQDCPMALILASTSPVRHAMLAAAGIQHEVRAPQVDEESIKRGHDGDGARLAANLAAAKALSVPLKDDDWAIGSDSVVTVEGRIFSKPGNRGEAADHLRSFSGRTMELASAVALARRGQVDWSHSDIARLDVRALSEAFIQAYLDSEWPDISYCVGVFRIEGRGVNLFDRVEGSHFTILGMPLIALLAGLREREILPS